MRQRTTQVYVMLLALLIGETLLIAGAGCAGRGITRAETGLRASIAVYESALVSVRAAHDTGAISDHDWNIKVIPAERKAYQAIQAAGLSLIAYKSGTSPETDFQTKMADLDAAIRALIEVAQ